MFISATDAAQLASKITAKRLANMYSTGAVLKKLHQVDVPDPVSAITTVDELYRFSIDSIVNQINFA